MNTGLRALLGGLIDYAGLYPPASLKLSEAAAEYRRYLAGPESWILNRFICPSSKLADLGGMIGSVAEPWPVTTLVSSLGKLDDELPLIEEFVAEFEGTATVECIEVRATEPLTARGLRSISDLEVEETFVEVALGDNLLDDLAAIAEVGQVGAKARTGGVTADQFPSVEALAAFIQECVNLGISYKMTAGLHHPYRQYHPSVKTEMHGFLNVLAGGLFAMTAELSRSEIEEVLSEQRVGAFEIDDQGIRWHELHATLDEIEEFRDIFRTIGSCSVEEPLEDLAGIGLLPSKSRR
ncbi:MAG: hypothetical protein HONBIEJF_01563 [Fimbriimonadaceae bacterium]|nr:hypothetical protein [Fimbriimonadaceae bacterium]